MSMNTQFEELLDRLEFRPRKFPPIMETHLCALCHKVLACWNFAASNSHSHLPSLESLIKSSGGCDMCRILLDNLSKENQQEIETLVNAGSYSKLIVCSGSSHPHIQNVPGPEAALYLEITTRSRYFSSRRSLLLPPKCRWLLFFFFPRHLLRDIPIGCETLVDTLDTCRRPRQ